MDFKYHIKIIDRHSGKTLILKIDIYYLIPSVSRCNQFLNLSIKNIGFAGATSANQHLTVKPVKRYSSFDNLMTHNLFTVFKHHLA